MDRVNSFDFIRLMAAALVVYSHSFATTGLTEPYSGGFSMGALGVWIFFILSGYLVSKSWDTYPRFNVFFAKRILRIIPGLAVSVIVTIIVAGLFFSTIPFNKFIVLQGTLNYLNNILMFIPVFTLPGGVFSNNLYPNAVNGSIWTLAYEFTMYLFVAFLGVSKIYKTMSHRTIWLMLFISTLVMLLIGKASFSISIFYLDISQLLIFSLLFYSGVFVHKEGKNIKLNIGYGLLSIVVFIIISLLIPEGKPLFASIFLAYSIFALGKIKFFSGISKFGDISYGIYIYSFTIQQIIAAITHTHNPYKMFLMSLVISVAVGTLSWHLIESRALKLKDRINYKKYPIRQEDISW